MRVNEERHVIEDHGQELRLFEEGGKWEVWLNGGADDDDGICLAISATREEVITDAGECLDAIAGKLLSL
jgi:hypothetical protein